MFLCMSGDELLLAKAVDITLRGGFDDLHGGLAAADLVDGGGLVLQVFVNREEVPHFLEEVGGELIDVGVLIIVGVAEGNGDDLFVVAAVVDHRDDTDGIGAHQNQGLDGFRAKDQHVQRVVVVAVGAGDEAVVGRVVGGGVQDAVENDQTGLLV